MPECAMTLESANISSAGFHLITTDRSVIHPLHFAQIYLRGCHICMVFKLEMTDCFYFWVNRHLLKIDRSRGSSNEFAKQ